MVTYEELVDYALSSRYYKRLKNEVDQYSKEEFNEHRDKVLLKRRMDDLSKMMQGAVMQALVEGVRHIAKEPSAFCAPVVEGVRIPEIKTADDYFKLTGEDPKMDMSVMYKEMASEYDAIMAEFKPLIPMSDMDEETKIDKPTLLALKEAERAPKKSKKTDKEKNKERAEKILRRMNKEREKTRVLTTKTAAANLLTPKARERQQFLSKQRRSTRRSKKHQYVSVRDVAQYLIDKMRGRKPYDVGLEQILKDHGEFVKAFQRTARKIDTLEDYLAKRDVNPDRNVIPIIKFFKKELEENGINTRKGKRGIVLTKMSRAS